MDATALTAPIDQSDRPRHRRRALAVTGFLGCALAAFVAGGCGDERPSTTRPSISEPASTPTASRVVASSSPRLPGSSNPTTTGPRYVAQIVALRLQAPRSRAVALAVGSTILLIGGLTAAGTTGSIDAIDPGSNRIVRLGRLRDAVHDAGGTVFNGSGFVFGGGRAAPGSAVQRVDPNGRVTTIGDLPATRADLASVTVGREMIIIGGGTGGRPDGRVLATSDGRRFRVVARLKIAVRYPAIAVLGGQVYVFGGATLRGDTRAIQVVDVERGTVRTFGRLASGLSHASALTIGDTVLLAGGRSAGKAQQALWQLDASTGKVVQIGRLPYPVSDAAGVSFGGVGYLIGGEGRGLLGSIISVAAG